MFDWRRIIFGESKDDPRSTFGKRIGSIDVYEQGIAVTYDIPRDQIRRFEAMSMNATCERLATELGELAALPESQIDLWSDAVVKLKADGHPKPFSTGLRETIMNVRNEDRDRERDVA